MRYSDTPAERAFLNAAPCFHLYTTPLESDFFFHDDHERVIALNLMAIAKMASDCKLLAYSIMTNHFHFILSGQEEEVLSFFERYKLLLDNYFSRHGKPGIMRSVKAGITAINDLRQLRTEIAYVIRNAFVARPEVNVFADPWSSGFLYFNPLLVKDGVSASSLKGRSLREFTCSRTITELDARIYVKDGVAQPWSFVDYEYAMSFYDNARQFVFSVLKSVEAQVETSLKYGDDPAVCDEELLPLVMDLSRKTFQEAGVFQLNARQKKELVVLVKNKYHSSNKQLARVIKIPLSEVDAMFPLRAKR
jgi:hypothetical protein